MWTLRVVELKLYLIVIFCRKMKFHNYAQTFLSPFFKCWVFKDLSYINHKIDKKIAWLVFLGQTDLNYCNINLICDFCVRLLMPYHKIECSISPEAIPLEFVNLNKN